MKVCDFSRSFVTFVCFDGANNARIQVEAICEIGADEPQRYLLVASCKSEDTYAKQNLFRSPNYDFCAIFSSEHYRLHRVPLPFDDTARDSGLINDRFESTITTLKTTQAEECTDARAVYEATMEGKVLVCRTVVYGSDGAPGAVLWYPVKTMNVRSDPYMFQIDTGPIILPDMTLERPGIDDLALAFVAWNQPDWAEFVIQQAVDPSPASPDPGSRVGHYCAIRVMDTHNSIFIHD